MNVAELLRKKWTLRLEIRLWHVLAAFSMLCFAAYSAWELYWFRKVGLYCIKWHTHLVFTAACCFALLLPLLAAHRLARSPFTNRLLKGAAITAITITLLELLLVVTGLSKNYMEKRNGYYQSPYEQNTDNYYHTRQPGKPYRLESGEFSYERKANALGYGDHEWRVEKDSAAIRIAALGDSFTEGDGAPADSSYPALLRGLLQRGNGSVEVLNAGVSGSDPFFGYKNFTGRLLPYQPDIVLQTISSDDFFFDVSWRGGWERFASDSALNMRKAPWWEPLAAASYVFREFLKAGGRDIEKPGGGVKSKSHVEWLTRQAHDLVMRYDSAGRASGVTIVWVIKPLKHEFASASYVFDFPALLQSLPPLKSSRFYDLLPCYLHHARASGNPSSYYYWQTDGHHNGRGYALMAACIAEELQRVMNGN